VEILSVSAYLELLNNSIKRYGAKIMGEVSEASFGPTGHVYFSLKDETDGSVIRCIVWKFKYDLYGVKIEEGAKIVVYGAPNIHNKYGFSFICETLEYAGEGVLKKEYEKLKKKLQDSGYFDQERKREIPRYPHKIGVITSLSGAVIKDFLNNIGQYGFKIKAIDSRVEGADAVSDLLKSIKVMKKQDIDTLVIMRGGGSLESMQAFNNELLVKEVVDFPVPVIAAIGHDKDIPLLSLVSDLMVSTPSIAATTLNKSWDRLLMILESYQSGILNSYSSRLQAKKDLIRRAVDLVSEMKDEAVLKWQKIESAIFASFSKLEKTIVLASHQIDSYQSVIAANNPNRQLNLGYIIARLNGKLVKSVKNVKKGDSLDLTLRDGTVSSEVKKINE